MKKKRLLLVNCHKNLKKEISQKIHPVGVTLFHMDGGMDGMDGWMNGWMEGQIYGHNKAISRFLKLLTRCNKNCY